MAKRFFSEKEAAKLVLEAAKLQEASESGSESYAPGISFDELAKMAREAGIDPKFLEQVLQKAPTTQEEVRKILGIPVSAEFERVIEAELPMDQFDVISEALESPLWSRHRGPRANANVPIQVGRMVQVKVGKGAAFGPLKVLSRHGRTRIQARQTAFIPFMAGLYPTLIFTFVTAMSNIEKSGIPLWLIPILLPLGLLAYVGLMNKGINQMRQTVDAVGEQIYDATNGLRDRLSHSGSVVAQEPEPITENLQDSENRF